MCSSLIGLVVLPMVAHAPISMGRVYIHNSEYQRRIRSWRRSPPVLQKVLGYEIFLQEWALGVSASRATWLINWFSELVANKCAVIHKLTEGLGRACFVFGALEWERPFLSPLYAFASLHSPYAVNKIPVYALVALQYMVGRLIQSN